MLRRLTRLWIVIAPVLMLTFVFDRLGIWLTAGVGYDGRFYSILSSGPPEATGVDHGVLTFAGNLLFLQTIAVPNFGSNGPMWSLANEFWYYVVFPLAVWVPFSRVSWGRRLAGFTVLIALASALPGFLLEGGMIWVAGAGAAWCARQPQLAGLLQSTVARLVAVIALPSFFLASKIPSLNANDISLGLGISALLPILSHFPNRPGMYSMVARASSEISYTLYLTHFPLLALIAFTGFSPSRWPPGTIAMMIYCSLFVLMVAWAAIVWWCFERQTEKLHAWLARRMGLASSSISPSARTEA